MARITEYSYKSADDRKTPIHAVKWEPEDGNTAAVLQLVHGMQEYIERYSEFAEYLVGKGFSVYGHDHIGHGDSVSDDADRGIMHSKHPADTMVADMFTNYGIIKKEHPDKPYFILGHSMGSYLLRKFLYDCAEKLSGVNGAIIMGTGSVSSAAIFGGNILCSLIMAVKGGASPSPFMRSIMFGGSYDEFDSTGEHPENSWLSHNVENVRAFTDPGNKKVSYDFSLSGYKVLLDSTGADNRMSNIRRMNMDIPIIFVSGDHDPVGDMGVGVKKAYEKFKAAGVKDLSIKLYEGDRHEILNELDRETVYADLYAWMKARF
ncbi:MAG: alpha/beta hydrolase [Lachnospiraceae bacterium]|nr:alpha/beta hydrolase [Lachnospiraceae bacterium]